ncbi:MAG TPA: arylsulfatase [Burkholderiales bacterium]|nr:arylsulfatase [Burkholderiales bacterium]
MPPPLLRALGSLLLAAVLAPSIVGAADRPNILYITVDDLGWKDVGYHGGAVLTPTLDRLAAEGARLEQFYVQPFSSQTRAAAMTGRYPMRYGLQTLQIQWFSRFGVPSDERLMPEALREGGYYTALIGKWQLGHANRSQWPTHRGLDYFYGHLAGEIDYFRKTNRGGRPDWRRNEKSVKEEGYATALLAREAVGLISRHDLSRPLFLWLAFAAPQAPLQAPPEWLQRYPDVTNGERRTYRAMISALDAAIGDVLAALERRGMRRDTLVVFHSTTGGALPTKYPAGDGDARATAADNGPLRDGKGSLYEGALRVVAIASWPGKIEPGVVLEAIHAVDLYPTLLKLAGAKQDQPKPLDGIDVWPAIGERKALSRKELLLNVEDFRGAIRMGEWKLIRVATLPSRSELYNLRTDPSEEDNQAEREPARSQAMLERLSEYAWEMAPSLYVDEMSHPHSTDMPIYWYDNPARP